MTDPKCSVSHHFGKPDETLTRKQYDLFTKIIETEAQKLKGKSREQVMTALEKLGEGRDLKTEIGRLRFSLRSKILEELERITGR